MQNYLKVWGYMLGAFSLFSFIWAGNMLMNQSCYYIDWEILNMSSCEITMSFIFDWMSLSFLCFVLFISSMVMFYSVDYMAGDANVTRFCLVVLLFVFSMVLLILSPNLISLLLGWDGLGLVSYCLVIYYQNTRSYNAGMITVLSNRLGDVGLLLSIALMVDWGGWDYCFYMSEGGVYKLLVGMIILAGMTKSAQIPFSAWLPAAMAAPTPVSALVHSSTLVTAGVYLLIRFSGCVIDVGGWVLLALSVGTMFMAGIGANFEYDLKKIIALSTLSQLGLMMMALSLGFVELAFFHLLTHAIFSALLFLCGGSIIHSVGEWQDIRSAGGMLYSIPFVGGSMLVSGLALCGFPFLAGFYSKDMILEMMLMSGGSMWIIFLMLMSIGMTACYTIRMFYFVYWKEFRCGAGQSISDGGSYMFTPIGGLSFIGVIVGGFMMWYVFIIPSYVCLPTILKISGLVVTFAGAWVGFLIGWSDFMVGLSGGFFGGMWYMPYLSGGFISSVFLSVGESVMNMGDLGWGEAIGGKGAYSYLVSTGEEVDDSQGSSLKVYLFTFFLWMASIYLLF